MPKTIGLTGKLKFDSGAAIGNMRKTSSAFKAMAASAKRVKAGMADIKKGFRGTGIAAAALTAGVVKTVKDFADFDFQITKAISLTKDGAKNMDKLRVFAKKMGAETFFTAKQAAEGMEALARAGLKSTDIMAALPKVLQLAAAEGIDLKTATDIVVKASNQFGISMKQAGKITDIFAFTSKNTATNVSQLAEGLKFVGTKAGRGLNITMQQTVGVLGLLSNVAADASVGGTVLNNALIKIGQNAKRGSVKVGKFKAQIVRTFDKKTGKRGVDLVATMLRISQAAAKIKDPVKRAAALTKLLGIRGEKAALAFAAAFGPKRQAETAAFFRKLQSAKGIKGVTKALADAQINTVAGQFKIFQSAVSGVSIAVGRMILSSTPLVPFMKRAAAVLGETATALGILGNRAKPGTKLFKKQAVALSKLSKTALQIAMGLREGFAAVKEVFTDVGGVLKSVGKVFGLTFGKGQLKDIIRITAKTLAWVGVLKLAGGTLSRVFSIAKGGFNILRGVIGGIGSLLGKFAGRGGGAGVGGALAKATAQPVKVVNFDELRLALAGQGALGGIGKPGGGLAKLREGLRQNIGKLGRFGTLLNSSGLGFKNHTTILGKAGGALGRAGLVGVALGAGVAFGTLIDKTFGLSDKFSSLAFEVNKADLALAERRKQAAQSGVVALKNIAAAQAQFAAAAKRGQTFETKGGARIGAAEAFRRRAQAQVKAIGEGLSPQQKAEFQNIIAGVTANIKLNTVVKLDGKVVARSTAKVNEEQKQRLGLKSTPGAKRQARTK